MKPYISPCVKNKGFFAYIRTIYYKIPIYRAIYLRYEKGVVKINIQTHEKRSNQHDREKYHTI
jgi:hypothetical protein